MSNIETIRKAADLMEQRARDATQERWDSVPAGAWTGRVFAGDFMVAKADSVDEDDHSNAEHIAGADPAVMLAVAEWLRAEAHLGYSTHALKVAVAYLREAEC